MAVSNPNSMDERSNALNAHIEPLMQESYAEISYDKQHRVIIAKWKGTLSLKDVTKGCGFMTGYVKEHQLQNHLSDHTDLKKLNPEVQAYLTGTWFFEVERAGLK